MAGPTTGINGEDPIVNYDENDLLIPGQWYALGPIQMDHWNIMGHLGDDQSNGLAKHIISKQATRLKSLPPF
jgi:hypothetical protein